MKPENRLIFYFTWFLLATMAIGAEVSLPATHVQFPVGITVSNKPILSWLDKESLDLHSSKKHILLVFGMEPEDQTPLITAQTVLWNLQYSQSSLQGASISVVLDANPDNLPVPSFPPKGKAYNQKETAAAHYLWRFIGSQGFDLVIDIRRSSSLEMFTGGKSSALNKELIEGWALKTNSLPENSFAAALVKNKPANMDTVAAIQMNYPEDSATEPARFISDLLSIRLRNSSVIQHSPARRQLRANTDRTPVQTARQLAQHYGHNPSIQYIPALAQLSRLHLAKLDKAPKHHTEVVNSLQPYIQSQKETLGKKVSGVNLAGHLTLAELARKDKNPAIIKLINSAAELAHNSKTGKDSPVSGHNQMSDSVFMVCPLLAAAHTLTGNPQYLEDCLAHFQYIQKLCLRKDGIYRHSPQDETAWGRGNGFPALGLTLTLSWLPEDSPAFKNILQALRSHIDSLLPHQDPTGMWHQVIDHPESYREMTSTCMITFAIARGIRQGWLEKEAYLPVIQKSWEAINRRLSNQGELLDVCTGTGKQKNLRNYFDRTAILGKDARGGAMALMASTEMAALLQSE